MVVRGRSMVLGRWAQMERVDGPKHGLVMHGRRLYPWI